MPVNVFRGALIAIALVFCGIFGWVVVPPLMANPDIPGALAGGFVNPYASGYSADVLCCWAVLAVWVLHERQRVRHGWVCLVLGAVPGVAVGFAAYLLLRQRQLPAVT